MEIYERIRKLRKNYLHMSQTDFGKHLGVSRSVINNIELNALARPEQKLSLLKLICKEFSVNEEWLMNGIEPMFVEPDTFNLNDFAKEHNITELETEIVKTYLELDPAIRKMLIEHFKRHLQDQFSAEPKQKPLAEERTAVEPQEFDWKDKTVEELEEEYKKSRLNSAQRRASAASSTIGGAGDRKSG